MTLLALLLPLTLPPPAPGADTTNLLQNVEKRYNGARTLRVSFEQSYSVPSRGRRTEAGELVLRKPGRMRWDYTRPSGKQFVSDGKDVYFYSPNTNRAEKMRLKDSDDMRAPMAFLLGRLDFRRDFREFQFRPQEGGTWVVALPKSGRLPYRQVEFLVSPAFAIQVMKVVSQDNSVLEFRFEKERLNPPVDDSVFRFKPPPGAEIVETRSSEP